MLYLKRNGLQNTFIETHMLTKHQKQTRIKRFRLINEHKMTSEMIAKWFGYKNAVSFRNSKSYEDMLQGIESILEYTLEYIEKKGDQ